jgi:uncharacterized membrane protein (DUF2068 family)
VLRLFAVERFARAAGLLLLAWGVLRFRASETSWQAQFDRIVPAARPLARLFDLNLDTSPTVARLRELLHSAPSTLAWLAVALVGYALIEALEGVGLWSLQRWGEYVAAVATSVFLPFEVYELSHHVTWVRLVALGINVVLVVYLVVAKRLFGVRGGAAAADRERAGDSLLEVEASAAATARRTRSPRGRPGPPSGRRTPPARPAPPRRPRRAGARARPPGPGRGPARRH